MTATRVPVEERSRYKLEATQADTDSLHIYVSDPEGKSWAQWWIIPERVTYSQYDFDKHERVQAERVARYLLCSRPDRDKDGQHYVIREFKDYDQATRHAMLRARTWLGSKWGLRTPARKLP